MYIVEMFKQKFIILHYIGKKLLNMMPPIYQNLRVFFWMYISISENVYNVRLLIPTTPYQTIKISSFYLTFYFFFMTKRF